MAAEIQITKRKEKNWRLEEVMVLDIDGEIDAGNAPDLKKALHETIDGGQKHILINMGKITYIDSLGIGTFISTLSKAGKQEVSLKICNLSEFLDRIFELTRLKKVFDVFETEEEALKSY